MGTANFHNVNANKIFAILPENEEESPYIYGDVINSIIEDLKELESNEKISWVLLEDEDDPEYLKSFPGHTFASFELSKHLKIMKCNLTLKFYLIVRSGYYQGANLDWSIEFYLDIDNVIYDELDYLFENIKDFYEDEYDLSEDKIEEACDEIKKVYDELSNKGIFIIENLYDKYTTQLAVYAQFSNGETIYYRKA